MKPLILLSKGVTQVKGFGQARLKAQHKTATMIQAIQPDVPEGWREGEPGTKTGWTATREELASEDILEALAGPLWTGMDL